MRTDFQIKSLNGHYDVRPFFMSKQIIIKLILIYLSSNAFCLNCENSIMGLDKTRFMLNDGDNTILFLVHPYLNVFNFTIKKSLKIIVDYKDKVRSSFDRRLFSGQTLVKDWIFENLEDRLSILLPYNYRNRYAYSRYQFEVSACESSLKPSDQNFPVITDEQKALSLLFASCAMSGSDVNLFVLTKNESKVIILKLSDQDTQLVTITPALTKNFIESIYTFSNAITLPESSKVQIHIGHEYAAEKLVIPNKLRSFLSEILYSFYYDNGSAKYMIAIKSGETYIYRADENYLLNIARRAIEKEDLSNIELPIAVDYFPNNYWHGCSIKLCQYESMDLIVNLKPNKEKINFIAFQGSIYFKLKFNAESAAENQTISNLKIEDSNNLNSLLISLINPQSKESIKNKKLYKEFINLNNIDAGDYLVLDKNNELFFIVKDNYVYQLLTTKKASSISQKLIKSNLKTFFGSSKVENSFIQSIFTCTNDAIVLIMDDFLLQYSYSNYLKKGVLSEIEEPFEIKSTFEHISTSFTFGYKTYIFARQFYQVFPVTDYMSVPQYEEIAGNFLDCDFSHHKFKFDPNLALVNYKKSGHRTTTKKPENLLVPKKLPNKLIIQAAVSVAFITFVIFVISIFYARKYKKNRTASADIKEKDKKSSSGQSANLSNIFNLYRSDEISEKSKLDYTEALKGSTMTMGSRTGITPSKVDTVQSKEESAQSKNQAVTESQILEELKAKKSLLGVRKSSAHSRVKSFVQIQSTKSIKNLEQTNSVRQDRLSLKKSSELGGSSRSTSKSNTQLATKKSSKLNGSSRSSSKKSSKMSGSSRSSSKSNRQSSSKKSSKLQSASRSASKSNPRSNSRRSFKRKQLSRSASKSSHRSYYK